MVTPSKSAYRRMRERIATLGIIGCCALLAVGAGQAAGEPYRQPPAAIAQLVDAPPLPSVEISGDAAVLAVLEREGLPPIAGLARPIHHLAGIRVDPPTNGPAEQDIVWFTGLAFIDVETGHRTKAALPAGARFLHPAWSPDNRHLAFALREPDRLSLWIAGLDGQARRLADLRLNAAFGRPFAWMPDGASLIVRQVVGGRGEAPRPPQAPAGPAVQESRGVPEPERPYRGLLRNAHDEALFAHYFSSELLQVRLDGHAGPVLLPAGVIGDFSVSPDGRLLLVSRLKPPFSHSAPAGRFPRTVDVWEVGGRHLKTVLDRPETEPQRPRFGAVPEGPRSIQWRADRPAELVWVEAQDGGDPDREAPIRDRIYRSPAPFLDEPAMLADLPDRFSALLWGYDTFALVYSFSWRTRAEIRTALDPSRAGHVWWTSTRNFQAAHDNPGNPVPAVTASGHRIMRMRNDGELLLAGRGAGIDGERPFLAAQNVVTGEIERLWTSGTDVIETVAAVRDADSIVTRRQSRNQPPNHHLRRLSAGGESRPLTFHADPMPAFAGVGMQTVSYRRDDGLPLSGTLYLPPGYDRERDGPLPLLIWVYPLDYVDADSAGQTVDAGNRYTRPQRISPLFLTFHGYAVFERPSMPIVARDGGLPNDSYLPQLEANARAAIDTLAGMGVADRERVAIGGHSYGAFTAANLLAHTGLFRAGIALSGAYNRTLTPFGFQAEERTYWEAPELYHRMSPFSAADRIDAPLLIVHGAEDENAGTHPLQSQRLFAALKALGATARHVELPHEGHGFRARESILHILAEEADWLDRHLKAAE